MYATPPTTSSSSAKKQECVFLAISDVMGNVIAATVLTRWFSLEQIITLATTQLMKTTVQVCQGFHCPLCKIALVNQISMSFFYVYQTALVQTLLSNSPRKIMDQERHGNVKIVKNASITTMFAITKLSVLMEVTKWNAVSISDIVKSIL